MQQGKLPQPVATQQSENAGAGWLAAMAAGDFAAAWAASDRVLACRPPAERDDPGEPYHLRWVWDGTAVDGREVLVRCYHGLGDTLQFCRYLPALRRRAARVTLEVQPELMPLLALVGGADRIVKFDPASPSPPSECDVEIMELAHALRIAPQPLPYLPIKREAPTALRVGLCWRANAGWRPERSMPDELAASIAAIEGVAWQGLLKGTTLPGLAPCPDLLLETARTIAGLDLVITVDTMVAHLAGAIGVPVWLLLDMEPDWRWLAGGRGSVWYRGVQKYQQIAPGDWTQPLRAVTADLTRLVQAGTVEV